MVGGLSFATRRSVIRSLGAVLRNLLIGRQNEGGNFKVQSRTSAWHRETSMFNQSAVGRVGGWGVLSSLRDLSGAGAWRPRTKVATKVVGLYSLVLARTGNHANFGRSGFEEPVFVGLVKVAIESSFQAVLAPPSGCGIHARAHRGSP